MGGPAGLGSLALPPSPCPPGWVLGCAFSQVIIASLSSHVWRTRALSCAAWQLAGACGISRSPTRTSTYSPTHAWPAPCSQFSGTACCLARLSVTHRLMLELSPGLFSSVRHMLVHSARAPAQLGTPAMISACFRMFRISHVSPGSSSGVRPLQGPPSCC